MYRITNVSIGSGVNVQNHISKMGLKPGQDGLEHGDWPPLQSLGEDGVVGVGTALHRHIPGLHKARAHGDQGEKKPLDQLRICRLPRSFLPTVVP